MFSEGINMIARDISKELLSLSTLYPVLSVTGPRQSGKTTLLKTTFPKYTYINLEEPATRQKAINDPTVFLRSIKNNVIIDEAQYVPDIFSAVQVISDENEIPGRFILSGSQNFLLLKNITQSLAGRVAILKLLPLSFNELLSSKKQMSLKEIIVKGSYPRLYNSKIKSAQYYRNYIDAYIARDVRDLLDVRNIEDFKGLLKLLASQTGQLVNYQNLSKILKVDQRTIKS